MEFGELKEHCMLYICTCIQTEHYNVVFRDLFPSVLQILRLSLELQCAKLEKEGDFSCFQVLQKIMRHSFRHSTYNRSASISPQIIDEAAQSFLLSSEAGSSRSRSKIQRSYIVFATTPPCLGICHLSPCSRRESQRSNRTSLPPSLVSS